MPHSLCCGAILTLIYNNAYAISCQLLARLFSQLTESFGFLHRNARDPEIAGAGGPKGLFGTSGSGVARTIGNVEYGFGSVYSGPAGGGSN